MYSVIFLYSNQLLPRILLICKNSWRMNFIHQLFQVSECDFSSYRIVLRFCVFIIFHAVTTCDGGPSSTPSQVEGTLGRTKLGIASLRTRVVTVNLSMRDSKCQFLRQFVLMYIILWALGPITLLVQHTCTCTTLYLYRTFMPPI